MFKRSMALAGVLLVLGATACSDDEGSGPGETGSATSGTASDSSGESGQPSSTGSETTGMTETTAESTTDTGEGTGSETSGAGEQFPPGCELPIPDGGFMDWCDGDAPFCADGHGCYLFGGTRGVCSTGCETDADCVWGADDMCSDERFACVEATSGLKRCLIPCMGDEDCFPGSSCVPPFAVCLPDPP